MVLYLMGIYMLSHFLITTSFFLKAVWLWPAFKDNKIIITNKLFSLFIQGF